MYKISLDAGFTCPVRDGKLDTRGCIFCSAEGSGDYAASRNLSITEQIEQGKAQVEAKQGQGPYIAYFQAYTNTYDTPERLRQLYLEAIQHPDIGILSIATRPDCLDEGVLEVIEQMNRLKPVWVELGLQTIHESTATYIRRGYILSVYDEAVRKLLQIGISQIITHVILGLPGESREDMLNTVRYVGQSGVQGIKLQLLHVLQGTDLAREYAFGKVSCMSMEEYTDLVADCIVQLPEHMVIHRMTGDGNRNRLIAPLWSLQKKTVLNMLQRKIREKERTTV